ncbi:MAG: SAM-dependent methyltransferase [Planctomycetia bacterium]
MASLLARLRGWRRRKRERAVPEALIRPDEVRRREPGLHVGPARPSTEGTGLISQLCRHATLASPAFRGWAGRLREPWRAHRKLWELAFLCQALAERRMLEPGRRGLGFAVGAEKLPSFFASLGCRITATDLPSDDERNRPWAATGQWVGTLEALNESGLCPEETFRNNVAYRPVDMNRIPDDLAGYDFTWSTCSFEHCGDLALGLEFLERQMDCLRPGGIAVHTTEFNLSSNDATLAEGPCVVYRLQDVESVCRRLVDRGHTVEPLDIDPGREPLDEVVDVPPYHQWATDPPARIKHLRLNLAGYVSTSIALIIRKAA